MAELLADAASCSGVLSLCLILLAILPSSLEKELCYIDNKTGNGIYCETECCRNIPLQCCNKTNFVIQCSVVGAIGAVMLVVFLSCMLFKRRQRKMAEAAAAKKVVPRNVVSPSVPPALCQVEDESELRSKDDATVGETKDAELRKKDDATVGATKDAELRSKDDVTVGQTKGAESLGESEVLLNGHVPATSANHATPPGATPAVDGQTVAQMPAEPENKNDQQNPTQSGHDVEAASTQSEHQSVTS